jgi:hypothetical protein
MLKSTSAPCPIRYQDAVRGRRMTSSIILEKVVERIESSNQNVLLRRDFADLGSGSQVG